MTKKKNFRLSITIVLTLVLVGIIFYPKYKSLIKPVGGSATESNQITGPERKILFASGYVIVPTQLNELINSTGSLLPDEEVDLAFETSGKIVGIFFDEGSRVKKGELLSKINDKPLQAQLLKLHAQKKLAEEKEFRQRQLLDRDAISRESYDQAATELQSIEADILLIEARIEETELRAPFDGVVGLRMISEGAYATTQTKIIRLVKNSPLKIEFAINERYSGEVSPGFPITFQLPDSPVIYDAKVYAVDPKVNLDTRTILLRALYSNQNQELKPGRSVKVVALLSQIDDAISIPTEALIAEMEGEKVFIYKNGKAKQVRVTTGLRTESSIQITEGLNFGDTLLTTAILQLRESLPVQLDTVLTNQQKVQ